MLCNWVAGVGLFWWFVASVSVTRRVTIVYFDWGFSYLVTHCLIVLFCYDLISLNPTIFDYQQPCYPSSSSHHSPTAHNATSSYHPPHTPPLRLIPRSDPPTQTLSRP